MLPKSTDLLITRGFTLLLLDCRYECLCGEYIFKAKIKAKRMKVTLSDNNDKH